jgi:hypothetical protein
MEVLEERAALAIQRASQARTRREEVRRLEGVPASYPADLAARVADLEEGERRRAGWNAALPSLARERGRLAEARGSRLAAQRTIDAGTIEAVTPRERPRTGSRSSRAWTARRPAIAPARS